MNSNANTNPSVENTVIPAEQIGSTIPRKTLFTEDKVDIISLADLKTTIKSEDIGSSRSRTKPIEHYEFIDAVMEILDKNGQAPAIDHIYVGKSPGTKLIKQVEEQLYPKAAGAWLIDRITGKINLPSLGDADMNPAIAFSYHDKGIDLAFGTNVSDCSNMCIFGNNLMRTYGSDRNVDYNKMLDAFSNWASKMEQMSEVDKAIIREMQTTYRSGRDIVEFIGKLMVAANAANIGKKIIAPLNVSQINEVIQGILRSKEQIFLPNNKVSVWEFYNTLTNVLKGNKSDIVTLLADTNNISNMTADALLNK